MFANPKTFCIFDYLAIFIKDQSRVAVTGYDWDEKIEYFNEKSRRWWLDSKDLLEKFDFFLFLVWSKFLLSWGRNYNKATHHPPISCRATFIVFNTRVILKQQRNDFIISRVVNSVDVCRGGLEYFRKHRKSTPSYLSPSTLAFNTGGGEYNNQSTWGRL